MSHKNATLILSLISGVLYSYAFWRFYKTGQLYRAKQYPQAEESCNMITLYAIVFGVTELVLHKSELPLIWLMIGGYAQYIKFSKRNEASKK